MTFWNFVYMVAGMGVGYYFLPAVVQFIKDFMEGL